MVRESPELVAVVARWMDAMNRREYDVASNLFMRTEHFRYVGSDAHEWWKGVAPIDAYRQRQSEMPPYRIEIDEIEAFEVGQVGWAALSTVTTFEGLKPRRLRWTMVFILDEGIWRIVQIHDSFAVPNPEVMGIEMTKSLEDLLAAMDSDLGDVRDSIREGTVTIVFTDIEDSTELAAGVGDAAWAQVIDWHDATIREAVEANNGTVVKMLGDGAMAVFQSVRDAARTALVIQRAIEKRTDDPPVRVRIGMHVGDAVLTDADFLGTAVNKAARVAAAAGGGQIMASAAVRVLLGDDPEFRFGEVHSVELKGIEGRHDVSEMFSTT